ncbi:MAG: signal peptidase II [Chlamydiota bacterium]
MRVKWMMTVLGFCLMILGIDIFSKMYTYDHITLLSRSSPLYPYGGIAVFKNWVGVDFSINYAMNKGAAWGIFSSFQEYLLYARLLIMGGLLSYILLVKMSYLRKFSLFCVLTGAVGNVIDFFLYGHVVDMFNFSFWGYSFPVFNVADSMIFFGVVCLLLQSSLEKRFSFFAKII